MESSVRNVIVAFVICLSLTIYAGSQLSFDKYNTNPIFILVFFVTFSYVVYFFVFGTIIYHKKISYYTIQKIQKKIENTISCSKDFQCVRKLGDLAVLISFLSLSIITTNSTETFSSLLPGDDLLHPIFEIILERMGILVSDDTLKISIPYISSTKFIMLSSIGPIVVFVLRLAHYLQLRKIEKLPKKERKQSEFDDENKKFPGVRILIIFLLVSPVILAITRMTTSNFIAFDFTLLLIATLSISGWLYVWLFLRFFENYWFAKLLK